jgi:hypothetical protein
MSRTPEGAPSPTTPAHAVFAHGSAATFPQNRGGGGAIFVALRAQAPCFVALDDETNRRRGGGRETVGPPQLDSRPPARGWTGAAREFHRASFDKAGRRGLRSAPNDEGARWDANEADEAGRSRGRKPRMRPERCVCSHATRRPPTPVFCAWSSRRSSGCRAGCARSAKTPFPRWFTPSSRTTRGVCGPTIRRLASVRSRTDGLSARRRTCSGAKRENSLGGRPLDAEPRRNPPQRRSRRPKRDRRGRR